MNTALLTGFIQHMNDEDIKKTHHFNGRYENIYISSDKIPEVQQILSLAISNAAKILKKNEADLKAGLWFNAMGHGQLTTAHRHDDDDELLSAVYYVKTPQDSGNLILQYKNFTIEVQPEEGLFVFFPPDMIHQVTENRSQEMRLSLGINIGPK
ncbi:MAG: 2OG-Fe(II) oxygenase family protein [Gammaproteobacteria bacterium]|nr:2OG-Fe(II) oxygenase family protein [Gammaproteobacteria bacterium]